MWSEIKVNIPSGLHTRPAGRLASLVQEHNVECFVHYNEQKANAISILDLIMLMIPYEAQLRLEVYGERADDFLEKATELLNDSL